MAIHHRFANPRLQIRSSTDSLHSNHSIQRLARPSVRVRKTWNPVLLYTTKKEGGKNMLHLICDDSGSVLFKPSRVSGSSMAKKLALFAWLGEIKAPQRREAVACWTDTQRAYQKGFSRLLNETSDSDNLRVAMLAVLLRCLLCRTF